jgi:hypothetical protein
VIFGKIGRFFCALSCLVLSACAAAHSVQTLAPGKTELSAGAGGPLSSDYAAANPPPIPVLTVGARRGLSQRSDVFADLHAGAFAFGLTWLDAGGSFALFAREKRPYLLASGTTHLISNFHDLMLLQQISFLLSYRIGSFTPYVGWDSLFELVPRLDYLPILMLGSRCEYRRYFVQPELRWYAPFSDGTRATMHYLSPAGAGALGVSLSLGVVL